MDLAARHYDQARGPFASLSSFRRGVARDASAASAARSRLSGQIESTLLMSLIRHA
jgi:hypothetical protein